MVGISSVQKSGANNLSCSAYPKPPLEIMDFIPTSTYAAAPLRRTGNAKAKPCAKERR
jgi:hypothetical protein